MRDNGKLRKSLSYPKLLIQSYLLGQWKCQDNETMNMDGLVFQGFGCFLNYDHNSER